MMVYENYTQTNIKWLEQIPSHWKLEKMKYLFYVSKKENEDETPNVLSLTQKGIIERDISTNEGQLAQSYVGYNIIEKDDIVFNPMDLLSGYVSKSKFDGVISQAYTTIKPLKDMNVSYYEKFFQNWYHYGTLWHLGKGVSYDNRWTLNNDTLLNIKLPVPPLEEQNKIVDFIDKKAVQIEKFIKDKTRFIKLLKEQKEAVINEAVTNGLDDSVELKDSEIEWLGDIPKHWEIKKLKYVAKCLFSNVDKHSHEHEREVLLCNYTDVYKNDTITQSINFMKATATDDEIKKFLLQKDDVIITKDSETPDDMAMPTYVAENFENVLCGYHLALIRPKKDLLGKFLYFLFMSTNFNIRFEIYSNGVTRYGLGSFIVNNSKLPFPPYEEQVEIVEYIENELKQLDNLIEKTTKEIELIKEYKTSLINEAVCGKIKVS